MSTTEQLAKPNLPGLIDDSLKGEDILSTYLGGIRDGIVSREQKKNGLRARQGTALTDIQIQEVADKEVKEIANTKVKDALAKATKGEFGAQDGMDMNKMMGMAGAAGAAHSAATSGNPLSLLSVIPAIMGNFGEYITAFFQWISGSKPSFGEALQDLKAEKSIEAVAKELNVDPVELKKRLTQKAPETSVVSAPATPAANATVQLDDTFKDLLAKDEVKKQMEAGNVREENGKYYATPQAVATLDALSAPPASTPSAPPVLPGKKGESWAV